MTKYPPPTPMSSLGRELGIMFAFIGAGLVTMAIYTFFWRIAQRKTLAQDLDRRKAFHSRTAPAADSRLLGSPMAVPGGRSQRTAEKMLDRYVLPGGQAEISHGMQLEENSGQGRSQSRDWMNGNGGEGFDFGFGGFVSGVSGRDLL